MTGKEEIKKKGYMEGKYVVGQGKAHKCCRPHTKIFNCNIKGTFNIRLKSGRITEFTPTITTEKANYWFIKLRRSEQEYYGWATRDHKSRQAENVIELLTKQLLPDELKEGRFALLPLEKWDERRTELWAEKQYWFQTFLFSPKVRADSEFVWNVINKIRWGNFTVLDIGSHYGYFSFKASESGAKVLGVEPHKSSLRCANIIRDHIIQQDVEFIREDPGGKFDVILFLSVYHQIDPTYRDLCGQIERLKARANKHLFVELILPPLFPQNNKMREKDIDEIVGGQILARYKHKVRGDRKIYWLQNV